MTGMETISKVCRTCTEIENDVPFSNICDAVPDNDKLHIWELLRETAPGLNIQANDALPQHVCQECVYRALDAQEFQQMCLSSQHELRSSLIVDTIEAKYDISLPMESSSLQSDDTLQRNLDEMPDIKQEIDNELSENTQLASDVASKKDISLPIQIDDILPKISTQMPEIKQEIVKELPENFKLVSDETIKEVTKDKKEVLAAKKKNAGILKRVRHNKAAVSQTFHICPMCDKIFQSINALNQHLNVYEHYGKRKKLAEASGKTAQCIRRKGSFPCLSCGKIFGHTQTLKRHKKLCQIEAHETPFNCEICSKPFDCSSSLAHHKRLHKVEGQPFECPKCKYRYPDESSLLWHEYFHHVFHDCMFCGQSFGKRIQLQMHLLNHAEEVNRSGLSCKMCPDIFRDFTDYTRHFLLHLPKMNERNFLKI